MNKALIDRLLKPTFWGVVAGTGLILIAGVVGADRVVMVTGAAATVASPPAN